MKSKIKQNVMLRVKAIRLMRPFASDASAAFALLLVALYGIGNEVWVAKVVANMPSVFDLAAMTNFMVAAFVHTEFVVQVLAVLALGAMIYAARAIGIALANELIQQQASRVST